MGRSAGSFNRGAPKFKVQPRVLVICEDTKSSKIYLEEAAVHYRTFALVEFSHCGRTDPLGVVEGGIKRAKDFEKIFCVIDRDSHDKTNFEQAIALAEAHPKTKIFTSYPCFEFWLLLHFTYSRAPYTPSGRLSAAGNVLTDLRKFPQMESYAKGEVKGLFSKLLEKLEVASERAVRTLAEAEADGEKNPSTPMHELIAELKQLGGPTPAPQVAA